MSPRLGALMLAALWLAGCGSGEPPLHPGTRRLMLRDLPVVVIVPTYDRLVAEAGALAAAAAELEATPAAVTLAAAQAAWRQARAAWKQSAAFAFGPAVALETVAKVDWVAIRPSRIEAEIAGSAVLDRHHVAELGANAKGFFALEYLLFDADGDDEAVLMRLGRDPRRRRYVVALADDLRAEVARLRDAWAPDAGNYAGELATAGHGSTEFPTVKRAVDTLVNQLIFVSDEVASRQLLAALGGRTGGTPNPAALPAHRSETGLADVLAALAGIERVYFDSDGDRRGRSFDDIAAELSADGGEALAASVRRAVQAAAAVPPPLERAVVEDPAAVERAQRRAAELMQRLEIDLVSLLGTTLRFNPSDGD